MKVLVVGSGGREHALIWKIAQSSLVEKIFCAPGNGGIGAIAECVHISVEDVQGLADFAQKEKIDLMFSSGNKYQKSNKEVQSKKITPLDAADKISKKIIK